jgi:hypothetical protein
MNLHRQVSFGAGNLVSASTLFWLLGLTRHAGSSALLVAMGSC